MLAEVTGFGRASAVVMSATTFAGVAAALVALRLRAHVIVAMVVAATATALVRVAF